MIAFKVIIFSVLSLLCLQCCIGWVLEFPDRVDNKVNLDNLNQGQLLALHFQRSANLAQRIRYNLAEKARDQNKPNLEGEIVFNGNPNNRGSPAKSKKPQLLIVAFDGFRFDYPKFFKTPNLDRLAKQGMWAPSGLKPIFATKTFPNFYSIATGLYQETHGLIDNHFYDPQLNVSFNIFDENTRSQSHWYEKGEPIWVTARRQGLKVGNFFWPGSDVTIHGMRPDFWRKYDSSISYRQRVDTVMSWLDREKVDLAMMYVNEPDWTAHYTGPFSDETKEKIEDLDKMVGYLMGRLQQTNLLNSVNVLLLSDHGMAGPNEINNKISISDYIHIKNNIKSIPTSGTITHIDPLPGKLMYVYNKLKNAHPHMKVYLKKDLPERWHYSQTDRIMPIIAVPDEGYVISKFPRDYDKYIGQHGYDNELDSMKPMFYGYGPQLRKKVEVESFETINLYNLMCRLMKIEPSINNGTMSLIEPLLSPISTP